MLEDIAEPTELMIEAMQQGIKTIDSYTAWLHGYDTGYKNRQQEVMKVVNEKENKCQS